MVSIFWGIILTILILLISYLVYETAILTPIIIKKESWPELQISYTTFIGPYKDAYQNVKKVEEFLQKKYNRDFSQDPCFGIYYDNPQKVEANKCRSVIGKILPSNIEPGQEKEGLIRFDKIEAIKDAIVVDYPLRSFLSIITGIIRTYPKLSQYLEKNGGQKNAMIELYGYRGKNTTFLTGLNELTGLAHEAPKMN